MLQAEGLVISLECNRDLAEPLECGAHWKEVKSLEARRWGAI